MRMTAWGDWAARKLNKINDSDVSQFSTYNAVALSTNLPSHTNMRRSKFNAIHFNLKFMATLPSKQVMGC